MDSKTITREELAGLFDHTYLKAFATKDDLKKLCDEAEEMQTAMVAINSSPVKWCAEFLKDSKVHVGAAISFPLGPVSYTHLDVYKRQGRELLHFRCKRRGGGLSWIKRKY